MTSKIREYVEEMESILEERSAAYGAGGIFNEIASCWSALTGSEIDPPTVCLMMVMLKLLREKQSSKRDNINDLLGYIEWYLRLLEQEE